MLKILMSRIQGTFHIYYLWLTFIFVIKKKEISKWVKFSLLINSKKYIYSANGGIPTLLDLSYLMSLVHLIARPIDNGKFGHMDGGYFGNMGRKNI